MSQRVALVKNMLRRVLLAARGSSAQSVTVVGGGVNVRRIAQSILRNGPHPWGTT